MTKSTNKKLGKNKYYNSEKGKRDNHFFFLLPSIIITPKKFLTWDTKMFSVFFGIGRYFAQYNVFEEIKDNSISIQKNNMVELLECLRAEGLYLDTDNYHVNSIIEFLNKNQYIILLLKNSNLQHSYIRKIIYDSFKEQKFMTDEVK